MINRTAIQQWSEHAPWIDNAQIEQDLIICRALVSIFSDEFLASQPVLMRKENSKTTRVLFVRSSILREDGNHRYAFPFAERLWLTSRNSSRPLMPLRN